MNWIVTYCRIERYELVGHSILKQTSDESRLSFSIINITDGIHFGVCLLWMDKLTFGGSRYLPVNMRPNFLTIISKNEIIL